MTTGVKFSGYVLAGGKSSRMRTDKAFLEIGGATFLERAVKILRAVCGDPVTVVLNSKQNHFTEKIPPDIKIIFDVYKERGATGGIHAALKNCKCEYAVILAIDLPFADERTIKFLMKTAIAEKDFSAIVPRQTDGRLQPLCAIYKTAESLAAIEKLFAENKNFPVKKLLDNLNVKIVDECFFNAERNLFLNVNTPEEYENLTRGE